MNIAIALIVAATAQAAPAPMSEDDRISVLVLQNLVAKQRNLGTPIVCVQGHEPSSDVLRELRTLFSFPIEPCAASRSDAVGRITGVKGEPGVVFNVRSITRVLGKPVVVHAGYYCGSLCAAEYEYQMGRSKLGEWLIVKQTMLWIS